MYTISVPYQKYPGIKDKLTPDNINTEKEDADIGMIRPILSTMTNMFKE